MIKPGVKVGGLKPEMVLAYGIICSVASSTCVITSAMEGQHMSGSLHYTGYALDIRWPVGLTSKKVFTAAVREALGADFDVVQEETHLHVEFDPEEERIGRA